MTPPEEIQTNCGCSTAPTPKGLRGDGRSYMDVDTDKSRKTTEKYKEKYRLLSLRSAMLQQENEELTNKLTTIKETIRKARKIRRQLLMKLDADNDAWRLGSMSRDVTVSVRAPTNPKTASVQLRPATTPVHPQMLSPPIIPLPPLSHTPSTST